MRDVRSRRARAAAAASVLLLGLTACGSGDPEPVAGTPATESTSAQPSSPGADAEADETESDQEEAVAPASRTPQTDRAVAPAGGGSWDEDTLVPAMMAAIERQESSRFRMTTTGGGADMEAEGQMALRGDQQDMAMTMSGPTLGVERMAMRVVDGVVYLSMPPMTPRGKFVEVSPDDQGSPFAGMTDQLGVDPRKSVEAFEEGLRDVRFLGEEDVAGETLERYRLTVDFAAASKAQGLPPGHGMPKTVDYDMWLDRDALMRRMEIDLVQVTTVMEMFDWGEPVTIAAPARKDVVPFPGR